MGEVVTLRDNKCNVYCNGFYDSDLTILVTLPVFGEGATYYMYIYILYLPSGLFPVLLLTFLPKASVIEASSYSL